MSATKTIGYADALRGSIDAVISTGKEATVKKFLLHKIAIIVAAMAVGSAGIATDALARGGGAGGHGGGLGGAHFGVMGGGHYGGAIGGGHLGRMGGEHFGAEPSTSITDTIEVWDTTGATMHVGRLSKLIRGGCATTANTSSRRITSGSRQQQRVCGRVRDGPVLLPILYGRGCSRCGALDPNCSTIVELRHRHLSYCRGAHRVERYIPLHHMSIDFIT
jgi:hypothetical protein